MLALCLHPALDITIYTNDGCEVSRRRDLGGKAINLARMLHMLGAHVTLVAPADPDGLTRNMLDSCGFACELVETNLPLRTNYKYVDNSGACKEQHAQPKTISPQHYAQLIHRVMHICQTRQISVLALCGSFPQGVEKGVYKSLTEWAKVQNIACVTDASDEPLSLAVQAKPSLIKPNLKEFSILTEQNIDLLKTQNKVEKAVKQAYLDTQVPILCSMDQNGSVYAGPEGTFWVQSRIVEQVAGFAGAGDTMLASFIFARMLCGHSIEHSLAFASASATAKVRLPANTLPCPDQIFTEWTHTKIKKGGT